MVIVGRLNPGPNQAREISLYHRLKVGLVGDGILLVHEIELVILGKLGGVRHKLINDSRECCVIIYLPTIVRYEQSR